MLKVSDLHVSYGYITAVNGISFEVNEGEIVTLIGSNGAGKSTTLMSISNLVPKESGTVIFKEQDITDMPADKIAALGIAHVPEGRKIFPQLSVLENLIAGTMARRKMSKAEIKEQLEYVYELFPRLKDRQKQDGGSLSGGEQQMLAIARGLMMKPDILMLDEPSLGLAPILVEEIFELLSRIRDTGKTILLIEQNASMALQIANRGYVLENGKIVLSGDGKDLLSNKSVKEAYLGG